MYINIKKVNSMSCLLMDFLLENVISSLKFRIKYGNSTESITSFVCLENSGRDYTCTGSSAVNSKEKTNKF